MRVTTIATSGCQKNAQQRAKIWTMESMHTMTDTHPFGAHLRKQRERLGLTLVDIADELAEHGVDVSHQNVSKWENGASRPTPDKIRAIAAAYQLPRDTIESWYLGRNDDGNDGDDGGIESRIAGVTPEAYRAILMIIEADEASRRSQD